MSKVDYSIDSVSETTESKLLKLELQLAKYKQILIDNDLLEDVAKISDVEAVCINEITKLKLMSENGYLGLNEIKALDILHNNLLKARGKAPVEEKKNTKTKSVAELLSIVSNK